MVAIAIRCSKVSNDDANKLRRILYVNYDPQVDKKIRKRKGKICEHVMELVKKITNTFVQRKARSQNLKKDSSLPAIQTNLKVIFTINCISIKYKLKLF